MARGVPELDGPLSVIASDVTKLRGCISNSLRERVKENSSVYFDPIPSALEVRRNKKKNSFSIPWLFVKLYTITTFYDVNSLLSIQFNSFNSNRYTATTALHVFLMTAPTRGNVYNEAHSL